jgi:hypothetical protein
VPSTTLGKFTASIAGTAGAGGLGLCAFAGFRGTLEHAAPGAALPVLAAISAAMALTSVLRLILEYMLRKLDVEARSSEARSAAELKRARLEIHRSMLMKAEAETRGARSYRDLIMANALYVSVEQNGAEVPESIHEHLCDCGIRPCPSRQPQQLAGIPQVSAAATARHAMVVVRVNGAP